MWQLFALGAVFAYSLENIIDKFALVNDTKIDFAVATFCRVTLYALFTFLIGLTGVLGPLNFFFNPAIIVFGVFSALSSYIYTYLLRKVEVTGIGAIAYIAPLFFLYIDTTLLSAGLSFLQIAGITLLVAGGVLFTIDGGTWKFKKELSLLVWVMFAFDLLYIGVEAYLFKYMNANAGVSSVGFFVSAWAVAAVVLFIPLLFRKRLSLLLAPKTVTYIARSSVSKAVDAVGTLLFAQALIGASVSQVSSMEVFEPVTLFAMVFILQGVFGINLGERLGRSNTALKVGAVALLAIGGFLVS